MPHPLHLRLPHPHATPAVDAAAADWVPQVAALDADDRQRHLERSRRLARRLHWEAAHGFALTEQMVGAIAGHIAYQTLGLDLDVLRRTRTVVVHPTTMVLTGPRRGPSRWTVTDAPVAVVGHTSASGPLFVAWDAVQAQARHPELGRNVVFHELAHRLDLLDGVFDGTPPQRDRHRRERWITVFQTELDALRAGTGTPVLRPYAATNPAECFAVASEVFFTRAEALRDDRPGLYDVLADYYGQDLARS